MMQRDESASGRAQRAPATCNYKLDIPVERRRHSDPVKYVVYVLWLIGHSTNTIAIVTRLRRSQVTGIVCKSEYTCRANMTDEERQTFLHVLKEIRFDDGAPLDGGLLNRISWQMLPLEDGRKRRPARKAVAL